MFLRCFTKFYNVLHGRLHSPAWQNAEVHVAAGAVEIIAKSALDHSLMRRCCQLYWRERDLHSYLGALLKEIYFTETTMNLRQLKHKENASLIT